VSGSGSRGCRRRLPSRLLFTDRRDLRTNPPPPSNTRRTSLDRICYAGVSTRHVGVRAATDALKELQAGKRIFAPVRDHAKTSVVASGARGVPPSEPAEPQGGPVSGAPVSGGVPLSGPAGPGRLPPSESPRDDMKDAVRE